MYRQAKWIERDPDLPIFEWIKPSRKWLYLADEWDVLSDAMAAWKYNGVDKTHVCILFSDDVVESIEKCDPEGANGVPNYYMYVKHVHWTRTLCY